MNTNKFFNFWAEVTERVVGVSELERQEQQPVEWGSQYGLDPTAKTTEWGSQYGLPTEATPPDGIPVASW